MRPGTLAPPTEPGIDLERRLRSDMSFYAPLVLRIQTKRGDTVPFDFNRTQQIVQAKVGAQLAETGRIRALILKARQLGISTWVGARIYRGCTLYHGRNGLVVADKTERSETLFRIYERFRDHSPPELRPAERTTRRGREMLFNLPGEDGLDSQILVETAGDTDAGRSLTRWYLHLSEVAFWEHQTDTLTAVLQTVPEEGGEVYLESTANGVGDEFHSRWLAAEAGESDYIAIFLPWWIFEEYQRAASVEEREQIRASSDPWERVALDEGIEWEGELHRLTPEQLAWRRAVIRNNFGGDARAFRQEFPATALEAFLVSGNAFFDEEALLDYRQRSKAPRWRGNLVLKANALRLEAAERGYLAVWQRPSPKAHYVIGADTAEGRVVAARDTSLSDPESERGGRDFCSADVLQVCELQTSKGHKPRWVPVRRVVAHLHGRMAPEVFAEALHRLGNWYGCPNIAQSRREQALIGVERNHSSGQTTLRELRHTHGYRNLFWHRRFNTRTEQATEVLGFVTDAQTRQPMLDELAAAVRNGEIAVASEPTISEMFTFVRGEDGKPAGQEGTHDDRVMSLGITLQMARNHSHGGEGEVPEWEVAETPTGV